MTMVGFSYDKAFVFCIVVQKHTSTDVDLRFFSKTLWANLRFDRGNIISAKENENNLWPFVSSQYLFGSKTGFLRI